MTSDAVRGLHRPYSWTAHTGQAFTVCRECSEPDDWDDQSGPYLYPDVHLVDWPCATRRALDFGGAA